MIEKEKSMYEKQFELKEESNPIVAEVDRVKDLMVQAMGIKKDLVNIDTRKGLVKTDQNKDLQVKNTAATDIIKSEVQGILKTEKHIKDIENVFKHEEKSLHLVKKGHEFLK